MSSNANKVSNLILRALRQSSTNDGVSEEELRNLLTDKYRVASKYEKYIIPMLESGIEFGAIRKAGEKYYLGNVSLDIIEARRRRKGGSSKSRSSSRGGSKRGKGRRRKRSASSSSRSSSRGRSRSRRRRGRSCY